MVQKKKTTIAFVQKLKFVFPKTNFSWCIVVKVSVLMFGDHAGGAQKTTSQDTHVAMAESAC